MPSKQVWLLLALSLSLPVAVGLFEMGRLLFYSVLPAPEERLERALQILAYQRIPCPHAHVFDFSETSVTLQCRNREATQYLVYGLEPCSETWGCRWFSILCMYVEKSQPRVDSPT